MKKRAKIGVTLATVRPSTYTTKSGTACCTFLVRRRKRTLRRSSRASSQKWTTISAALSSPRVLQTLRDSSSITRILLEQPSLEEQFSQEPNSAVRGQTSQEPNSAVGGHSSR